MKTPQVQLDKEFAEWASEYLGERLKLIPRGQAANGKAIVGSGRPLYCELDGEIVPQYWVAMRCHEELAKACPKHLYRSAEKLGNVRSAEDMMRLLRRHREA